MYQFTKQTQIDRGTEYSRHLYSLSIAKIVLIYLSLPTSTFLNAF